MTIWSSAEEKSKCLVFWLGLVGRMEGTEPRGAENNAADGAENDAVDGTESGAADGVESGAAGSEVVRDTEVGGKTAGGAGIESGV